MTVKGMKSHARTDLTGRVFGKLTVVRYVCTDKWRRTKWECNCSCGNTIITDGRSLRHNVCKSCGCFRKETTGNRRRTHGKSQSPEHICWMAMNQRCKNPHTKNYKDYGGRGIVVCDRWQGRDGFTNFLADVGLKPTPNHSLDRIDVNGNYEPFNCKWATWREQSDNRRKFGNLSVFSTEELQSEINRRTPEYGLSAC